MNAVFIAGNVSSGKSTLWRALQNLLQGKFNFIPLSDRLVFESAVLEDTGVSIPWEGATPVVGPKSIYFGGDEPGKVKFHITHGELANEGHEQMVATVAENPDQLYIVEYTIASRVATEGDDITHTGGNLLEMLIGYGCAHRVCVIEPFAHLDKRILRNKRRPDTIPKELMELYFFDGGSMPSDSNEFLENFWPINNDHDHLETFQKDGSELFENTVLPILREGRVSKER